ncbi:partial Stage 0 sporulation protein J, partial [uncultured bacterium]
ERRFRACKEIGYTDIPAYVIKVESDELMLAMALIENIQREKLNPIEEAKAYKRLMEECSLTQEEIAERVGKDRTTIANAIRLLKLPRDIQQSMIDEKITMGHARALINVPGEAMQLRVLQKIIEDQLSVRSVESLVRKMLTEKKPEKHNPAARNPFGGNALADVEDRLRKTMGTKVYVKSRKNNQGEICIEYYSLDDFDRLIELFDVIQKNTF